MIERDPTSRPGIEPNSREGNDPDTDDPDRNDPDRIAFDTIYLDNAATTPLRPEAVQAMAPFWSGRFGNPSGSHRLARDARRALDEARDTVARCLGAKPGEVIFTGGGTEADNLAIAGITSRRPGPVVCSAVEHHAVLHSAQAAGRALAPGPGGEQVRVGPVDQPNSGLPGEGSGRGQRASPNVRYAPVDNGGRLRLDDLAAMVDEEVSVVSVMLANNEVGVVQPVAEICDLATRLAPEAVVHTDAVAAMAWLDVGSLCARAHMVSVSAHKFGGPKGVGALVVRSGVKVDPIVHGGGQERDRRSGTHNLAGIVGMAAAMEATVAGRRAAVERVGRLRDRLADQILAGVPGAVETGARADKVAGNCHVCIPGVDSEALLFLLDEAGVCASSGSACASGAVEPSHVLVAMGVDAALARGALRLSLGIDTTQAEIEAAARAVITAAARLRPGPC
ncbi:MAG: cysteine desulfurase family protein [Acidimicrobiales bacterium]